MIGTCGHRPDLVVSLIEEILLSYGGKKEVNVVIFIITHTFQVDSLLSLNTPMLFLFECGQISVYVKIK